MTREQAIEVLIDRYNSSVIRGRIDDEWRLATDTAIAALRGPEPDPETGLVPCGCGGQAVFEGSFLDEEVPSSYRVSLSCIECGISTIAYEYEQEAMKAWNTAMGWRVEG
jgi:hypothetical protein